MNKVKPEDIIPTRTDKRIKALGPRMLKLDKAQQRTTSKLIKKFIDLANDISKETIVETIEAAHRAVDSLNVSATNNSVCVKGCSHCCKVNVDVTAGEAAYIELRSGKKVIEHKYTKHVGSKKIEYCPFHDGETATCTIHEYRPITCRSFYAFDDPILCVGNDQTHAITTAFNNTNVKQVLDILNTITGDDTRDIRAWFGE